MSAQPLGLSKGADGTYRLTSMDIQEVSLVDRAANKRKFLFAKREDAMPSAELKESTDGTLVLEKDQGTPPDTVVGDVSKAISLPAAKKAELAPLAHKLVESALHFHNQVVGAQEVKEGAEVPSSLMDEAKAVKAASHALDVAMFGQAQDGDATPSETAGQAQLEGGAEQPKSKATKGPMAKAEGAETEIRKAAELHAKLLQEHVAAISMLADEIAKAESMDTVDLNAKIRAMSELGWQLENVAEVVNVSKAAGDAIDVSKVAKLHAQLLKEKIDAIKVLAVDIADNAASMDLEDLQGKISTLRSMGWRVEDVALVANVSKADTNKADAQPSGEPGIVDTLTDADMEAMASGTIPDVLAKIGRKMSGRNLGQFQGALEKIRGELDNLINLYRALLPADQQEKAQALHKRLIEDMGLPDVPADNAGGSFTWPESPVGKYPDAAEPGPAKDTLATLEKALADKEAEATALRDQLAKAEREAATVPAPSSGGPDGPQAGSVAKGNTTDDGWPLDMNASEYRRKVASGKTT